ncbi:MAG: protein kinase domain-containing protein, partial [Gammaproteobacteria bacterium]
MNAVQPRSPVAGYRVVRELSAGPGSRVCLCIDERNAGRRVALKLLPVRLGESMAAHALRAHRLLMNLEQTNLVRVYECGLLSEDEPNQSQNQIGAAQSTGAYASMEYLDGDELEELIFDGMSSALALDTLIALARGLAAAHEVDLVHGTLSPQHVLFRRDGEPVLIGFGSVDALRGAGSSAAQRRYCSPELRNGGVADRMSDICALGICFYDMLTGAEADEGEGPWPPALPEALSGFARLVEAMTAEDPHDRLQSADRVAEWALGLRNATSSSPAAAGESTDPVLLEGGGASTFGDDAPQAASVVTAGRPAPG